MVELDVLAVPVNPETSAIRKVAGWGVESIGPPRRGRLATTVSGRTATPSPEHQEDGLLPTKTADEDTGQGRGPGDGHRLECGPPDGNRARSAHERSECGHEGPGDHERDEAGRLDIEEGEWDHRNTRRQEVGGEHPKRMGPGGAPELRGTPSSNAAT